MENLKTEIKHRISNCCHRNKCYNNHDTHCGLVAKAVSKLRHGKSDGSTLQMSDHFINGTPKANVYLSLLFKTIMNHGVIPESMLLGTIIPIPKNRRKSMNDSSNYRGITLSSIMGKILDNILLSTNMNIFISSYLQFGFKAKHSTTHCTFVASQAFDRVEYVKLFEVLLNRNICPLVARLLVNMYTHQKLRVRYSYVTTEPFIVTNGVKQGGILSPILFAIYVDVLFHKLQSLRIGCYIGDVFAGVLVYADDILLMAPSITGLNLMLKTVNQYGKDFKIKFNPSKTKLVICGSNDKIHNVLFQETKLLNENCVTHLGNSLSTNSDQIMVDNTVCYFIQMFNYLMASFRYCDTDIKYRLFKSFCMSLYGCVMWNMSDIYVERFYVTWRKCIRRLLSVPPTTHSRYLHLLVNDISVESQIHLRFVKFFQSVILSSNTIVKVCGELALNGSDSTICKKYKLHMV